MNCLKPVNPEIVAYYWAKEAEYSSVADVLSIPRFSQDLMSELSVMLGGNDKARLVEAVSRLGNYSDASDYANMRKAVSKLLQKRGVKLPRGKRTKPELQELVESLTPLLLFFGLRLASCERSRLVLVLRRIADEFNVSGDPRDTLRSKIKTDRMHHKNTRRLIFEAVSRGLSPFDTNNNPL